MWLNNPQCGHKEGQKFQKKIEITIKASPPIYGTNQQGWGGFQRHVMFLKTLGPPCSKKTISKYVGVASPAFKKGLAEVLIRGLPRLVFFPP